MERRRAGASAEALVAEHLNALGWTILAAGVRVDRDEIDLVAVDPGPPMTLVFVEVRSRTSDRFGAPEETIGSPKIGRAYRAAFALLRGRRLPGGTALPRLPWRVDLVAVDARGVARAARPEVDLRHVRGIAPD